MNAKLLTLFVVISTIALAGCNELSTDYGATKGLSGRTSLNGFGALRRGYEMCGYRSRDVSRLTDRVRRSDVIVWTPKVLDSIDNKVTRWFDRWLKSGGKTLVYIVPDSGSEADYWMETVKLAPPPQRIEYRKRAGRSINERMIWRLNRGKITSNGWFELESNPYQTVSDGTLNSEFTIEPFDAEAPKVAPATVAPTVIASGPTGPSSQGWGSSNETTSTSTKTLFRSVLKTDQGDTIVAEIRSEDWNDSKVIVVAGGSLLTNFAFTHEANQRLAAKLISDSSLPSVVVSPPVGTSADPERVAGFLTSDWMPISVSETKPGVPIATGMELLTVWPLSLVTMHGVMLGFVICLMLWPVFGRPKKVQLAEHSNFGDHLDAVAALMNRTGGEAYARERISEYFKRIRGETTGPWVFDAEKQDLARSNPLPSLSLKRIRSVSDLPTHEIPTQVVADKEIH